MVQVLNVDGRGSGSRLKFVVTCAGVLELRMNFVFNGVPRKKTQLKRYDVVMLQVRTLTLS